MFRGTRFLLAALAVAALLGMGAVALVARGRLASCAYVPMLGDDLLPNAGLSPDPSDPHQAAGWGYRTSSGVELQQPRRDGRGFDLDGDDRALQLIGIANYVETPAIPVAAGRSYCFSGFGLTDQADKGATRVQVVFRWIDAAGAQLGEAAGDWQPVALWQPGAAGWSPLRAASRAPAGAAQLRVRLRPAADNRLYLDAMHVRRTTNDQRSTTNLSLAQPLVVGPSSLVVEPWPNGNQAALSFSFDWETTMGGLVHSRSLAAEDPNNAVDPQVRGMRMRQGITNTLDLFRAYDIRATYYATGYNFLRGNAERRTFMGDPTFDWASQANGWKSDWSRRPWFGSDPHGTLASNPDYYFGDLVPLLLAARQDIQTHTFSHLYGGYASPEQWRADFETWRQVARAQGVAPARSLAFPWSSSGGMSDDSWRALEAAGITSVTRTNRSQSQYRITSPDDPRCAPVPGHERILACPDFYLHGQESAAQALGLIDRIARVNGTIDLWAHTEEVTSPDQVAAWEQVVGYAAQQRDAGKIWIAPLAEIADWQQALADVRIQEPGVRSQEGDTSITFSVANNSMRDLKGLTVRLPFDAKRVIAGGENLRSELPSKSLIALDIPAGRTMEVTAWPS